MSNQKRLKPSTIIIGLIVLALFIEAFTGKLTPEDGLTLFIFYAAAAVLHTLSPWLKDRISGFEFSTDLSLPLIFAVFNYYSVDIAKIFTMLVFAAAFLLPARRSSISRTILQLFAVYTGLISASILKVSGVNSIPLLALVFALAYLCIAVVDFKTTTGIRYGIALRNTAGLLFPFVAAVSVSASFISRDYLSLIWLTAALAGAYYVNMAVRQRNRLFSSIRLISRLASQSELEGEAVLHADNYVRQTAAVLAVPPYNADAAVLAVHLHEAGRAGMEEYSVDHIMETISAEKGEPLHAERAHHLLAGIAGFEVVAESLRLHHRYERKPMSRQERKKVSLIADIVAVLTRFGELLAFNSEKIYTEKDAFKDLKKESGWSLNPSVVRALRMVLLARGIKRI